MSSQDLWSKVPSPSREFPDGKDLLPLEYEAIKQRVTKGAKILSGHWQEPEYAEKVFKYNQLCRQMLEYEIENDLLPI
jgi:hypothetical protein